MRWPMLIASAAFALAPTAAQAYGGVEDANGCHTNKKQATTTAMGAGRVQEVGAQARVDLFTAHRHQRQLQDVASRSP